MATKVEYSIDFHIHTIFFLFFCCSVLDFMGRWLENYDIIICLLFNQSQTVDDVPIDLVLTQTWIHFRWRRKKCNRPKGSNMRIKMITFFINDDMRMKQKMNVCIVFTQFKLHVIFILIIKTFECMTKNTLVWSRIKRCIPWHTLYKEKNVCCYTTIECLSYYHLTKWKFL